MKQMNNKIDGPILSDMVTDEQILSDDIIIDNTITYHYSIAQNTEEWDEIRKGKITASPAKCLLVSSELKSGKAAAGSVGRLAKGAVSYAEKIAKQRYSPNAGSNDFKFYSLDMERGHETESAANQLFQDITGIKTTQVGFLSRKLNEVDRLIGCSPDRIILDQETGLIISGLEMKSANSDIQFARLRNPNLLVDEHMAQVQFQMFISGANSWYLTSYNESFDDPKDRLIICKILRNNAIIEQFHNQVIEMESYINDVLFDIKHLADIESVW